MNGTEEDMEFKDFIGYEWDNGVLMLKVQLESGKTFTAPLGLMKKDRPIELARFIRNKVVEAKRGRWYEKWAKGILKQSNRTLRRLHGHYNTRRIHRLSNIKTIKIRRISRNKRTQNKEKELNLELPFPIV